jgi:MoxR-like ATPase
VPPAVNDYLLAIVRATRAHPALRLGASPRGSLGLFRAAQAMAAIDGQESVSAELVKSLASQVLAHRFILRHEENRRGVTAENVVAEILADTPLPG